MLAPSIVSGGRRLVVAASVLLSIQIATPSWSAEPSPIEPATNREDLAAADIAIRWRQQIRPILAEHCLGCHGAAKQEASLSLQSIRDVFTGGASGPLVDHESPDASLLVAVLEPDAEPHMPPEKQLDGDIISALREWVRQAAAIAPDHWEAIVDADLASPKARTQDGLGWPAGVAPSLVIDLAIQSRWQREDSPVQPAPLCDDGTFLRRLYLDLVGRIPTSDERDAFLEDGDSRKRSHLIDRLLESPEHARHMAELFDTILLGRGDARRMKRRQQHQWLDFLTSAFAENRPWDRVARQILLARPESPADAGAVWYLAEHNNEVQAVAESVSRGVFGVQIQCAQCHDHPMAEEIKQAHYWGLVAFFNRSQKVDTPAGPRVAESAVGGFSMFTNLQGESQPNRLVFLNAEPVDEPRAAEGEFQEDRDELYLPSEGDLPKVPRFSRRQKFVDNVLADHPLVARAMVNRLWALMMGRGLVHPVDQLDSVHPPSHPELLDWLSNDFHRSGYDVRRLLREIARTEAYQRESASEVQVDPSLFAVGAVKPLAAETLYRSLLVALQADVPESWDHEGPIAEFRHAFPDVLADDSVATPRQALLVTNGPDLHRTIAPEHAPLIPQLAAIPEPQQVVEQAFRRVLGREATAEELDRCVEYLRARSDRPMEALRQLVWTLLGSAEFRFNH